MSKESADALLAKKAQAEDEQIAEQIRRHLFEFQPEYVEREIEDRYLISGRPSPEVLEKATKSRILVGYTDDDSRIRLETTMDGEVISRTEDGKITKTEQYRRERRQPLTQSQFNIRFLLTEGSQVEKIRWEIEYGKYIIHYDEFQGQHVGHCSIEVEARSRKALEAFATNPPDFFRDSNGPLERLTGARRILYSTKSIAKNGVPRERVGVAS